MYENLACFYDMFTGDVDTRKLADLLEERFKKYGNEGLRLAAQRKGRKSEKTGDENGSDISMSTLVMDVGCGTGKLAVLLSKRGYDVTGLDASPEMLEIALERAGREKSEVLWICQDMREMDTFGSYAAMYCLEDGLNHLTEEGDIGKFLKNARNFIDDGGLLIFDFLTDGYLREAAKKGVLFEDGDDGTCLWTADYQNGLMTYDIICYLRDEDRSYERLEDTVCERALETEDVTRALRENSYSVLELLEGEDGRNYVTARKV